MCRRLDSGSQVFSNDGYPFHAVRYFRLPEGPQCEMICSTSYSSSVSIRSGGGFEKLGPCVSVSLWDERREAWKTLCIFHVEGRQRQ